MPFIGSEDAAGYREPDCIDISSWAQTAGLRVVLKKRWSSLMPHSPEFGVQPGSGCENGCNFIALCGCVSIHNRDAIAEFWIFFFKIIGGRSFSRCLVQFNHSGAVLVKLNKI